MKAPSPDALLASMSEYDWKRWQAWMLVRGAIGPLRDDYYATYLAKHARHVTGNRDGSVDGEHFYHPWTVIEPVVEEDDPYDTYDPKRDGEVYL